MGVANPIPFILVDDRIDSESANTRMFTVDSCYVVKLFYFDCSGRNFSFF